MASVWVNAGNTTAPLLASHARERGYDPLPFGLKRILRHRLAGLAVPVAGIAEIALDAVQVRMHPSRIRCRLVLDDLVRLVPLAFGRPPQRFERRRERRCG